jgi:preprotein translocase subunit SecD
MMYFGRGKTLSILAVCLLGALLCLPNLIAAPAAWLPWHQIHLGLDLRGGSYLLMQVDMSAVEHERLDALADDARGALLKQHLYYQNLAAEPSNNRVFLHVRNPAQQHQPRGAGRILRRHARWRQPRAHNVAQRAQAHGAACGGAVDRNRAPPHRRDRGRRSANHPPGG